jgi:hypothetical protein
MAGKGDTPRPLSVTPDTYAANYARIRWTDDPPGCDEREKFCPPLRDLVTAPGEAIVDAPQIHTHNLACAVYGCHLDDPVQDSREVMRQRHLAEAKAVIDAAPVSQRHTNA